MKKLLPIAFLLSVLTANAQNYSDTTYLKERFKKVDHILNILREFRIQAYIQPEWQRGDTTGTNVQGGNFPSTSNNRFIIRRGRVKLSWMHEVATKFGDTAKVGEFAFQFDATEKGFNALKDFYGRINDPWTGWFGLQAGITVRPFGWESPAPPSTYESPEFARMNQTIMPNECELGETFIIESPRTFKPVYLRLDAGVVNGTGIGNTGTNQSGVNTGSFQSAKDFVGRLMVGKIFNLSNGTKIGFNVSGSYYYGNVLQTTYNVFEVVKNAETGLDTFKNVIKTHADSSQKNAFYYKREYYGAHAQLQFDYKISGDNFGGTTMIRGEFIGGQQPGQASSSTVPIGTGTAEPTTTTTTNVLVTTPTGTTTIPVTTTTNGVDLYIRKFSGIIATFTQSFHWKAGSQMMHSDITVKYDAYNPNTQVSQANVNAGAKFSTTDLAYKTISAGYTICPVPYFKLMIWYHHVMPASTGFVLPNTTAKGDVLTLRTQFMIDSWWFDKKPTANSNLISRTY